MGDSDYALAERLAVSCIVEPPYAPISEAGLAAAREAMRAAGVVLVCPIPLGAGNIGLLDAALAAAQSGAQVILLEPEMGDAADQEALLARVATRDYSGRGPDLYRALLEAGAEGRHVAYPGARSANRRREWIGVTHAGRDRTRPDSQTRGFMPAAPEQYVHT